METIEVVITEKDVLHSDFSDSENCALCKAINRVIDGANPNADADTVSLCDLGTYRIIGRFSAFEFEDLLFRARLGDKFEVTKTLELIK